jgi:hypothetical protein
MIDFTPELRAEGLTILKRYRTDQSSVRAVHASAAQRAAPVR